MFRVEKNTSTVVSFAVNEIHLVSEMVSVRLNYNKLNTEDGGIVVCNVVGYDCFNRTIDISIDWEDEGGEFYVMIGVPEYNDDYNNDYNITDVPIYEGLMYVNSGAKSSGLNGVVIQ